MRWGEIFSGQFYSFYPIEAGMRLQMIRWHCVQGETLLYPDSCRATGLSRKNETVPDIRTGMRTVGKCGIFPHCFFLNFTCYEKAPSRFSTCKRTPVAVLKASSHANNYSKITFRNPMRQPAKRPRDQKLRPNCIQNQIVWREFSVVRDCKWRTISRI